MASQKFTMPFVTGLAPASTVAVRVTTIPEATVPTGPPGPVCVMVVVVALPPAMKPLKAWVVSKTPPVATACTKKL